MDPIKTAPFELGRGPDAVLLIHGFTGSPWDMRPLGEALAEDGYFVKGMRLPGHGLSPEDMLGVTWRDWERAVAHALTDLAHYRRVFVCGLSMGALLALTLAAEEPERIAGLVLLAPAARFRGPTLQLLRASRGIPLFHRLRPWIEKDATDIADPVALRDAPILRAWPAERLYDLWRIQDNAAQVLDAVQAPTLVMVAEQDHVVAPEGARDLARALKNARAVTFQRIDQGFHIMPRDHGRERVATEVRAFFNRIRSPLAHRGQGAGGARSGSTGAGSAGTAKTNDETRGARRL